MRVWQRRPSLERICAGLAVASVTLLACGESDRQAAVPVGDGKPAPPPADAPSGADALRALPGALEAAGTSRVSTTVEMASGSTRITLRGEGHFDYREQTGEMLITLPDDPGSGAAGTGPVREVFTPGALYMKNGGSGVPSDVWVRMATADLPDGNLVTGGATDPLTAAELLAGVVAAEDLGWVAVGGERLHRYRGTADIEAAARSAATAERREQLLAAAGAFTETAVPFDAYLDGEGRLRQVRHRFSYAESAGSTAVSVLSTTLVHDFGTPVDIRLPATDETIHAVPPGAGG